MGLIFYFIILKTKLLDSYYFEYESDHLIVVSSIQPMVTLVFPLYLLKLCENMKTKEGNSGPLVPYLASSFISFSYFYYATHESRNHNCFPEC